MMVMMMRNVNPDDAALANNHSLSLSLSKSIQFSFGKCSEFCSYDEVRIDHKFVDLHHNHAN